jgi:hypothetical protein
VLYQGRELHTLFQFGENHQGKYAVGREGKRSSFGPRKLVAEDRRGWVFFGGMTDPQVVVDYVQSLDLRVPIIHLYTFRNNSTSCCSFIPLEDTQLAARINLSNRLRRLVTAAGVDDAEYL